LLTDFFVFLYGIALPATGKYYTEFPKVDPKFHKVTSHPIMKIKVLFILFEYSKLKS